MTTLRVLWHRIAGLVRPARHDAELDEEFAALVQLHVDEYVRAGRSLDAARRRAMVRLGGAHAIKDASRDQRGLPLVETTLQDARFGARMLRRHRGYSAVAILTLALGVGATTAMFTIVDRVLLRPFPFAEPDRLVMLWETNPGRGISRFNASAANYTDWRSTARSFSELGAWELRRDNRTDGTRPEQVIGAVASSPFFRALGLAPHVGRFFSDAEDTPAQRLVAVLGYEYWQRAFAGDAGVLDRVVVINGEAHTVIGVMPPARAPFRADVWRPLAADMPALDRGHHSMLVVGRLAPGQSMRSAEAEMRAIAAPIAAAFPESNRGWSVRAESMYEALVPQRTRVAMWTLMAAVALLLLISCVNVASVTLARGVSRVRELSTRFALGAARGRLMRQLVTESALVAAAGGIAGILLASWMLDAIKWLYPADVPGLADATLSAAAMMFAIAIAGITMTIFGLLPAYHVCSRFAITPQLSTRATTAAPRTHALGNVLVAAQIALALVLLIGSGLLLASVRQLLSVPLGFGPSGVVTGKIALNDRRYESDAAYVDFVDRLLASLQSSPGVASAGVSSSVPFDLGYTVMQVRRPGDKDRPDAEGITSQWRVIGGDYTTALGIPLVAGRAFAPADDERVPLVTIISESLAQRIFGADDPIGRDILVGDARRPYRVVGVAGAVRLTALDAEPEPAMYFHYRQFDWPAMTVVLRAAGDPGALAGAIRSAVAAVDPTQPVFDERLMPDFVDAAAAAPRMHAAMVSAFALVAMVLAAVGVYGTMSYTATQRLGEMSLRLVLGARPSRVFLTSLASGARTTFAGLAIGLSLALAAAGSLAALLFQVSAYDPRVYAAAAGVLLAVALAACGIPARRAMRADPMTTLRQE